MVRIAYLVAAEGYCMPKIMVRLIMDLLLIDLKKRFHELPADIQIAGCVNLYLALTACAS